MIFWYFCPRKEEQKLSICLTTKNKLRMKSDIEIARETVLKPITEVAKGIGIDADNLEHYGKYIAKVPLSRIDEDKIDRCNLILMTAMSPTKAGIGKTTVSVGLSMALNRLGYKCGLALREPSMGPCFGMKGGAAGGGYSQVLPMDKINLHFTGDFHAITAAHNLIAALLDNYIFRHQGEPCELKTVYWGRVLDVNDRALRKIVIGLGAGNGVVRESGFDISVASEIMAILCLAKDLEDLRSRLENILLGVTCEGKPFYLRDLGSVGSILVILKDALQPNLVQTIEHTAAFIHGGPFANIAHGCNSLIATKMAMSHSDYTVTEAGFGADLGAEKFLDIKCRMGGIRPKLCVLVVTVRGLKLQGGMADDAAPAEQMEALRKGLANMERHVENLQNQGQTVVVTLNRYGSDTDEELRVVADRCKELGIGYAPNECFAHGGAGCEELARVCVKEIAECPSKEIQYPYNLEDSIVDKVDAVAKKVYRAGRVEYTAAAKKALKRIKDWGLENLPICVAKTQYSFSDDANKLGTPEGFTFTVRDFVINTGSGMIVVIAGDIMRMPGLPKRPQSEVIDIVDGEIEGLA